MQDMALQPHCSASPIAACRVMGGTGVSGDTIVERIFREVCAFRIYDGPTEEHKWSLAKKIKRDAQPSQGR